MERFQQESGRDLRTDVISPLRRMTPELFYSFRIRYNKIMETIKTGKVTWIDVLNPTEEELSVLKRKFRLHEIIVKELQEPSARARVEQYDGYIYLIRAS